MEAVVDQGWPSVTSKAREKRMENLLPTLALGLKPIMLAIVLGGWAWTAAVLQAAEREYEPDVTLAIKEKAFHVVKKSDSREDLRDGSPHPGFSLAPGENVILELRNEDRLPHEFVSPLFTLVEFQFWGKATLVYTHTATGIRVDPGETVALGFELPKMFAGKQFKFWCNVHGKLHDDTLQGEIFVIKTKQGHRGT